MENIKSMQNGLASYIRLEGYTKSSLAKKCSIDPILFKKALEVNSEIEESKIKEIILKVMEIEGITVKDLEDAIFKEAENEVIYRMEQMKQQKMFKSRDEKRIEPFLEEFKELWSMYPDLRFGQLISSLSSRIDKDSFYAEDDVWLEALRKMKEGRN